MDQHTENTSGTNFELHKFERRKSSMWWLGQVFSVFLGISSVGASGSITVGLIVSFALGVLVDIREILSSK